MNSLTQLRKSLSLRINCAIWAVCGLIVLVFGFFYYTFEKQHYQEHIAQAEVLLQTVYQQKREELANEIFAGHWQALEYSLDEIIAVRGIDSVQIFDLNGEALGGRGAVHYQGLSADVLQRLVQGGFFEEVQLTGQSHVAFSTVIEMLGERLGYFSAALNLSDLVSVVRSRILLVGSLFTCVLVVLSVLVNKSLKRAVVLPVAQLHDAMNQVKEGLLGRQVAIAREDEIGRMAEAFNVMSDRLKEQHDRLIDSVQARDAYAAQLEETNRRLAQLNAELEDIVERRTRELRTSYEQLQAETIERQALEERLLRSRKMEALGVLAGGVAHDLNNVLSGIVSYPELILMDLPAQAPQRKMVEGIQRSGQRAAAIVQDLLTLARRGVTNTLVLNLNREIIEDYLESPEYAKLRSNYPGVGVETRLAADLLNIQGSPIHLRKTVMNLVANAAEAQSDGGRIVITTENRSVDRPLIGYDHVAQGDYVLLSVRDYGSGIAPEDLSRIFEPFYTKKVMGRSGTGLGMAVVWGTVQDHHGYINVDSRLGQGTLFELYFPVTRQTRPLDAKVAKPEDYRGHGETVLVIDDIEEQRQVAVAMLTRLNYRAVAVASGEQALEHVGANRVDILLLDMIMDPGIDGLETYRRIVDIHPSQRCVIASGFAENERVKEAQSLGAGPYIRKPYTMEKIGLALRAELDKSR